MFCTTTSPGPGWRIRPAGGSANPAAEERSIRTFRRSEDHEIPFLAQRAAPAIAQIDDAGSKPSLTTVDSMLEEVTHTGVSRDAGSVMLGLAGSTVFPFSRADGGLSPANRIVARATASWASL